MVNILQNILLGISLAAPVGPVTIEAIKRGLNSGFSPAFILSLGAASADATYLILIYLGLSNFIHIPIIKGAIWVFGGIVLMYLGILSIKKYYQKINLKGPSNYLNRNSYFTGYILNITNPMTIIWWVGIFGSLLGTSIQNYSKIVALLHSLSILFGVIIWSFLLSASLHWGKKIINENSLRYISLISGMVLIVFGVYFEYNAITSLL
jgi:threonine/homoserine/homoserine lactone efflux protein